MIIAQISDLHIRPKGALAYGVSETNILSEKAIHTLLRLSPKADFVLVTGDLTDCGLEEEYSIARDMLDRLPMPYYVIPGNHDRRDAMRLAFEDKGYFPKTGYLNYSIKCGDIRVIALDSVQKNVDYGVLHQDTLDFLEETLNNHREEPILVMLHHPPFDTGIAHMDKIRLLDGLEAFANIIQKHNNVLRILCGHVHRSVQKIFAKTLCQIAPSVAHQVTFDLDANGPSSFMLEPPAFLVHQFDGLDIISHNVQVERFAGPFPFILPDEYPGKKQA